MELKIKKQNDKIEPLLETANFKVTNWNTLRDAHCYIENQKIATFDNLHDGNYIVTAQIAGETQIVCIATNAQTKNIPVRVKYVNE